MPTACLRHRGPAPTVAGLAQVQDPNAPAVKATLLQQTRPTLPHGALAVAAVDNICRSSDLVPVSLPGSKAS